MPTISNLNEYYQSIYTSYLSERYERMWHMYTEGSRVAPVMTKSSVEKVFGISFDDRYTGIPFPRGNTYVPFCEVQGPYVTFDLLSVIAQQFKLTMKKSYDDLRVAYNLCLYNNSLIDRLPLFADTMYNAVQLHSEFVDSVLAYFRNENNEVFQKSEVSISISVDPQNGVCYKELMDYLHYKGAKPKIIFTFKTKGLNRMCVVSENDYEARFTETSYNITIKHIDY